MSHYSLLKNGFVNYKKSLKKLPRMKHRMTEMENINEKLGEEK